ncbi:hypothetical protein N1851_017421 [Merluccius polli]|uniref:Uncharacterized protein n=1 Tax=Merluccius polli TaxID=89951 RepID=A0AA47P281_MERPO|nr:hypothetical protein N1851_017421 [Merluccius polli]
METSGSCVWPMRDNPLGSGCVRVPAGRTADARLWSPKLQEMRGGRPVVPLVQVVPALIWLLPGGVKASRSSPLVSRTAGLERVWSGSHSLIPPALLFRSSDVRGALCTKLTAVTPTLLAVGILGYRAVGILGYRAVGILGYRVVGILGYRVVGILGYRVVGILGYRVVGILGYRTRPLYCRINLAVPVLDTFFNHGDTRQDFRLSRESLAVLLNLLHQDRRHGWGATIETLVFLFWLASGASYRVVSRVFGMPRSTVHRIVHRVTGGHSPQAHPLPKDR